MSGGLTTKRSNRKCTRAAVRFQRFFATKTPLANLTRHGESESYARKQFFWYLMNAESCAVHRKKTQSHDDPSRACPAKARLGTSGQGLNGIKKKALKKGQGFQSRQRKPDNEAKRPTPITLCRRVLPEGTRDVCDIGKRRSIRRSDEDGAGGLARR